MGSGVEAELNGGVGEPGEEAEEPYPGEFFHGSPIGRGWIAERAGAEILNGAARGYFSSMPAKK